MAQAPSAPHKVHPCLVPWGVQLTLLGLCQEWAQEQEAVALTWLTKMFPATLRVSVAVVPMVTCISQAIWKKAHTALGPLTAAGWAWRVGGSVSPSSLCLLAARGAPHSGAQRPLQAQAEVHQPLLPHS